MSSPVTRIAIIAGVIAAAAAAGFAIANYSGLLGSQSVVESIGMPKVGGPFALVDQDNKPVTDATYRGKVMVVYFGYTFCPDVCPTELAKIATAVDSLGKDADQVAPIFITVDPTRDTPDKMKSYVEQFDKRMIGLTGSADQVSQVAKEYRVYSAKSGDTSGQYYLVDHTSFIYLMDRTGKYSGIARPDDPPEALAASIRDLLKAQG